MARKQAGDYLGSRKRKTLVAAKVFQVSTITDRQWNIGLSKVQDSTSRCLRAINDHVWLSCVETFTERSKSVATLMGLSVFQMMHTLAEQRETETQVFFRNLFHDDMNSKYIASTDEGGVWHDKAFSAAELINRRWYSDANWYVTHNGFTGCRRKAEGTRQLNALFYDIDCHDASFEEMPDLVDRILASINDAVELSKLPMPSLVVDSGRGVHLYYVLSRSVPYRFKKSGEINRKGETLFRVVQSQIADILEECVSSIEHAVVDRSVFDHTRVSRIPGTWNAKAWRFARLLHASEDYHHLENLKSFTPNRKKEERKRGNARVFAYNALMMSRLRKVEELQRYRGFRCEGNRERMAFVYYNTAVQIYQRADAAGMLGMFNARFSDPLPQREIDHIVASVDKNTNYLGEKGYYLLSAKKVAELLSLTSEEMLATSFFSSKRMMERMEAKQRTKERRDNRDAEIVRLYSSGSMTQKAVSEAVGCSLSTVKAVLASAGLTRRHIASEGGPVRRGMTLKDAAGAALSSLVAARKKRPKKWQACHVVNSLEGVFEGILAIQNGCELAVLRTPPLLRAGP